jgi:hypothetical protein
MNLLHCNMDDFVDQSIVMFYLVQFCKYDF